jgi:acyl-CoA synthetase (NDP forming)
VLKVSGPDLTHKSDVGGVALDVRDADAVREAARSILARVREVRPEAMVSGIMVQRQAPAGEDLIVGCVRDPQFGAIAMVGGGGVQVEEMRDVTFALAPLDAAEANRMLDATRAGRRLRGFRGSAPADRAAVVDALVALSLLAATLPEIAEIEINPLRVYRAGKGAEALDVRVRVEARLALA